jgi:hypothetical protein
VLLAQLSRLDPLLHRLRKRREVMSEQLSKSKRIRISPHNDPANAVALSVLFERVQDAKAFAAHRGVERLIDTGRHVYTNWEPIFAQRSFHPRMDPYKWACRDISYSAEMCRRTLDILERTCYISLGPQYPLALIGLQARKLAALTS